MKQRTIKEKTESLKQNNNFIVRYRNIEIKGLSFYKDGNKLGKREVDIIKKSSSKLEEIFRNQRKFSMI